MARFIRWPVGTPPFQQSGAAAGGRGSQFGGRGFTGAGGAAPPGMSWTRPWVEAFERNNQLLERFFGQIEDLETDTRRTGRLDNEDILQVFQVMAVDDIPAALRLVRNFDPEIQIEIFSYGEGDRDFVTSADLSGIRLG